MVLLPILQPIYKDNKFISLTQMILMGIVTMAKLNWIQLVTIYILLFLIQLMRDYCLMILIKQLSRNAIGKKIISKFHLFGEFPLLQSTKFVIHRRPLLMLRMLIWSASLCSNWLTILYFPTKILLLRALNFQIKLD
jgi:hypothetical protein